MKTPIVLAVLAAGALAGTAAFAQGAAPAAPAHPMSFFISSSAPPSGNIGGIAAADKVCQDAAASVGAGSRTWHAYLSVQQMGNEPAVNARDRIGAGPWYNAKGTLMAANVNDLHGDIERDRNNFQKANALTEKGEPYIDPAKPNLHDILTGTDSDGRAYPAGVDTTCSNWTAEDDAHHAIVAHGDRSGPNTSWNSTHLSRGCSKESLLANGYSGHLYCFAVN